VRVGRRFDKGEGDSGDIMKLKLLALLLILSAINMEMSGMHDSMKDMDMQELATLGGREFDLEFIRQMIPHHEGAVSMAREALQKSQRAEIKSAASSVIRDQEAEIKQMKGWQAAWQKQELARGAQGED
jgi:uncharacterized protein (DUF305 family)